MASRIFWVLLAGIALVTGMAVQDRNWFFSSDDERSEKAERTLEARVERSVERSLEGIDEVRSDGTAISPQARHALGEAARKLALAEADLAVLRARDASSEEIRAADVRRDDARAEVDRLKAEIARQERVPADRDAVREEVRREIRENVRDTIREAIRG